MIWHAIPLNDIEPHVESSACACECKVEQQDNGDLLIIHNAYDRRELFEEIEDYLNTKK